MTLPIARKVARCLITSVYPGVGNEVPYYAFFVLECILLMQQSESGAPLHTSSSLVINSGIARGGGLPGPGLGNILLGLGYLQVSSTTVPVPLQH